MAISTVATILKAAREPPATVPHSNLHSMATNLLRQGISVHGEELAEVMNL